MVACWERAGLLAFLFVMYGHFSVWCPGSGVVLDLSIPDLCLLSYFTFIFHFPLKQMHIS